MTWRRAGIYAAFLACAVFGLVDAVIALRAHRPLQSLVGVVLAGVVVVLLRREVRRGASSPVPVRAGNPTRTATLVRVRKHVVTAPTWLLSLYGALFFATFSVPQHGVAGGASRRR